MLVTHEKNLCETLSDPVIEFNQIQSRAGDPFSFLDGIDEEVWEDFVRCCGKVEAGRWVELEL